MKTDKTYELDILLKERSYDLLYNIKNELYNLGVFSFVEDIKDNLGGVPDDKCHELLEKLLDDSAVSEKITVFSYDIKQLESIEIKLKAVFNEAIECEIGNIETKEWLDGWKYSFKRIETKLFEICAPWAKGLKDQSKTQIIIEPAMAFGTGQHETTQLCLEAFEYFLLSQQKPSSLKVMDLGTGSGILAIAACKKGLIQADAIDIDHESVIACEKNAAINKVLLSPKQLTIEEFLQIYPQKKASYDLIFANILLPVLVKSIPVISESCNKGGMIILSGILNSQVESMVEACKVLPLQLVHQSSKNDWACLLLKKF